MNFGMTLASLAALYLPSFVFGALFAWSYHKEPRQFRNAIWLLLFLPAFRSVALLNFGEGWGLLPRKRVYDYIIIHGAGIMPDGTPTPLLRGVHGGPFHHDHGESSFFEGDHGCAQRRAIGPRAPWPRLPLRAGHRRLPCVLSQRIRASYRAEGGWGRQSYARLLLAHGVHPGVHSRYQGAFVAVLCARPAGH